MKIKSDILLVLFIFTALLTNPLLAQPVPNYTLTRYTDENGLPQNSVNAIAQDEKGFFWLATEAGLVRFDGRSFFTFDKTILDIPGNRIRFFLPASAKTGTNDPLFYSSDGLGSCIGVFQNSYARATNTCPGDKILKQMSKTADQTSMNYLVSLPSVFDRSNAYTSKLPDLGVLLLPGHGYYLRENEDISYWVNGKIQFSTHFPQNTNLLVNGENLYSAVETGALFRIDKSGGHRVTIKGDILDDTRYLKDKPGYFWNNITQQTFIHLHGNLYSVKYTTPDEVQTTLLLTGMDLYDHGVISICTDKTGNILLGSRTEGLYFLKRQLFHVANVPKDSIGSVFYAMVPFGDNAVITRHGYKIRLDSARAFPKQSKEKLGHQWLWYSLAKDRKGHMWVAERSSSVVRKLSKYTGDGEKLLASWNMPATVSGVYCDTWGTTWFQTGSGEIYSLPSDGSAATVPSLLKKTGLIRVNTFHRSGKTQLWIGTTSGMYVIDINTHVMTRLNGLAGKNIRSILGIGAELWICTYGNGMYLFKNKKLTHFPTDADKYMLSSHCIVPDEQGRLWISSNKGLFVAKRADLLNYAEGKVRSVFYYYYDKNSGFNTNEFNGGCQPCGLRLKSGNIAFPSLNGIVYFNPSDIDIEFPDKPMLISQVFVDGEYREPGKAIAVDRNFHQIQVLVSSPYFGNKKNIQVSYKLTNERSRLSWTSVADAERVYLTSLAPGRHTLNIRKFKGFGNANFSLASIDIIVPPYWYESKWFQAVLVFAAAVSTFLFLKARAVYLRKKRYNQNLLNNAKLYGDIITSINHDVQTPLHYVIYSLEQITKHLDSDAGSNPLFSRMGTEALESLRRISTLTNNLLHYLKVNLYQHEHSIAKTPVELYPLVDEIIKMFSAKILRDNITVSNLLAGEQKYLLNLQIFSVILHNLIDNAVKVSKNGSIRVSVAEVSNQQYLLIEDSGKGLPASIAEWLTGSREQGQMAVPQDTDKTLHSGGLGLIIVKDLCRLSDINLTVNVKPGAGTQLFVRLQS